jgi:hypothetical protein
MTMLALDWNGTRVRAVLGKAPSALPVALEPPGFELPLAVLEVGTTKHVGAAALRQCRSANHAVRRMFLHQLAGAGQPAHRLHADTACTLVWQKLHQVGASAAGIVLTLPGYLQTPQADALRALGNHGKLAVLGSTSTLLTAARAAHSEGLWQRSVLVIDADDHSVTLGWVKGMADKAHLVEARSFTQLGVGGWKERLLDVLSDLCVRQHRRDPRDAPLAEQSLFDQLDVLLDAALRHQAVQLGVQGQQWFKHLLVHPEVTLQVCKPIVRRIAEEAERLLACWPASEAPRVIVLTDQAARLPGLIEALEALTMPSASAETKLPAGETNYHDDDFGEGLVFGEPDQARSVHVLTPEAPASAVHGLGEPWRQGALPAGHLDSNVPLARAGRPTNVRMLTSER